MSCLHVPKGSNKYHYISNIYSEMRSYRLPHSSDMNWWGFSEVPYSSNGYMHIREWAHRSEERRVGKECRSRRGPCEEREKRGERDGDRRAVEVHTDQWGSRWEGDGADD